MIQNWRRIQLQNFTSWEKLSSYLNWEECDKELVLKKAKFPLNLPARLAAKAQKKSLKDPILKQFLPSLEEEIIHPAFFSDPVQDVIFRKNSSKVLQKYQGRALLLTSSACAMHCRYCFRKNFDYEVKRKDFEEELTLIQQDTSLKEIILSGGDPLSLSDEELSKLLISLGNIHHIKRIRFHTRFPIGIPERINESFLKILSLIPKQLIFVLHVNLAQELDPDILIAMKNIQKLGIPILTHTVLLKEVNDTVDILQELFETISNQGFLPYYLFQLDRVQGASHFEVSEAEGKKLMKELSMRLSGYALPKYAKEQAGEPSKTLITYL